MIKDAMLFNRLEKRAVSCRLCSHFCRINPGKFGTCEVRQNRDGNLITHVYGDVIALHADPIEKKPLYHYFPGSRSLSIATAGCNFRCSFCQNWQISQVSKKKEQAERGRIMNPEEVVSEALDRNCGSISYTYTEPTVFFEFAYDTARLAKAKGLGNVFVTNGYMSEEALEMIRPYLDACNVDLKSFRNDFYKNLCKASLEPVLSSIRRMKKMNIWVEVTTLVVPGQNDSSEELSDIAEFIAGIDPGIPWHISRFHPDYKMVSAEATPVETLLRAHDIAKKAGLQHVYVGNILGLSEDTLCPQCGEVLIRRKGFSVLADRMEKGACPSCGAKIPGRFSHA